MLEVNGKSPPRALSSLRTVCASLTCLFLSVILFACGHAPEAALDRGTVGRSSRPMDANPYAAEQLGREALEKLGYTKIIDLARQAGWVTTKPMEGSRRNDGALLGMDGAAAARGFLEVFSRYAVTAGVVSQVDSPLPGPSDVVGLGILVIGLLDAGILEGALLETLAGLEPAAPSSTTAAPPAATTVPAASATPTATGAPIATAAPIPTASETERKRCKKVKQGCIEYCSDTTLPTPDFGWKFQNCKTTVLKGMAALGIRNLRQEQERG